MTGRLLIFTPAADPVANAASVRMGSFIDVLRSNGVELEVLACDGQCDHATFFKLASNKSAFASRLLREMLVATELFVRILFRREPRVFLTSPPFLPTLAAALACRLRRKKYYLDIRDIYPEVYYDQKLLSPNTVLARVLASITRAVYRGAASIFTVTDGFADIISSYGIPRPRIKLIRNGYDSRIFTPAENQNEIFTFFFHGNLGHFQNIELLLSLAERMERAGVPCQFLVAGEGAKETLLHAASLKSLKFLGSLPHRELAQVVARAHVGLSFRTNGVMGENAFPVRVYEYIGAGIPSVITPLSEAGRIVEDAGLGRQFANEDESGILTCLIALARQSADYERLRTTVLRERHKFSRQEQARLLLRFLRQEA